MILVDQREQAPTVTRALTTFTADGIPAHSRILEYGDYLLLPPSKPVVGVERKTVGDLIHAYEQGRLFKQLAGLRSSCHYPWLLIEGFPQFHLHPDGRSTLKLGGRVTQWPFLTYYNGIVAKARHAGIPTVNTPDLNASLRWLAGYYHYLCNKDVEVDNETGYITAPPKAQDPRVTALCATPGLGPKTARALLDTFGDLTSVILASNDEIRKVRGVGQSTVTALRKVFPRPDLS